MWTHRGVQLYTHTRVNSVQELPDGRSRIDTARGSVRFLLMLLISVQIIATHVVFAVNAFSSSLIPCLKEIAVPVRAQMSITRFIGCSYIQVFDSTVASSLGSIQYLFSWWRRIFHSASCRWQDHVGYEEIEILLFLFPGGYRRASDDGTAEMGKSDDGEINKGISKALKTFLETNFDFGGNAGLYDFTLIWNRGPMEAEAEWTGVMCFTTDGFPLIGSLVQKFIFLCLVDWQNGRNQYINGCFTGHGMAYSFKVLSWGSWDLISRLDMTLPIWFGIKSSTEEAIPLSHLRFTLSALLALMQLSYSKVRWRANCRQPVPRINKYFPSL